jgi:signal peptidase I
MELRRRVSALWREWLQPFLVVALVLGSFRSAVADWNDVPSGSMIPTILEGDRIFVDRRAYDYRLPFTSISLSRHAEPTRGDIVVFTSPDSS